MMRDLTVEQYRTVWPKWNGSVLTQLAKELPSDTLQNLMEGQPGSRTDHPTECSPLLFPSKWLNYTTYVKYSVHNRMPQQ